MQRLKIMKERDPSNDLLVTSEKISFHGMQVFFSAAMQDFSITGILLCLVIFLSLIGWIRWRLQKLRTFQELGIPGPPPHFLFGNFPEINKKGLLNCQNDWIKKYGPILGYFNGLCPILLVADKKTLKRIFIKDFHLFSDRPEVVPLRVHGILDYIIPATKIMDAILLNLKGEEWKRVRTCLSPIFSTNKLKMMVPFVDKVIRVTLENLEQKARANEEVDIFPMLQYITLDVIAAQAFALCTNIQEEGSSNELYLSAKSVFNHPVHSKLLMFGYSFPEVGVLGMAASLLKMLFESRFNVPPLQITQIVEKVIAQRREKPETCLPDILQFLIDSSNPEALNAEKNDSGASKSDSNNAEAKSKLKSRRGLTDLEIKSNSLVVFLAGYETTSCALACAIHCLTKYPEMQKKLQSEIDRSFQGKDLDLNTLGNLHFMERFFMETMRFYPPAPTFVNRLAVQNVDWGYLKIPKGLYITVPVKYMHFCEENFEDPHVFDPDRFLLENRSRNDIASYYAFGNGPRNCIGSRLFTITSKVILLKLLQRFTFEKADGHNQEELNMIVRYGSQVPETVLVKVCERKNILKLSTEK